MSLSDFTLVVIVYMTYSVCDLPSFWAEPFPNGTENLRALYNKVKEKPSDYTLNRYGGMEVAKEDLESDRTNSSDDLKITLYKQGYLKLTKESGQMCTLDFVDRSDLSLYTDLMYAVHLEDEIYKNKLYRIKLAFERIPPENEKFESFMLALDTILEKTPKLFDDWELQAIFGALHLSGLQVKIGGNYADHRIIYCENLLNNTRLRIVVARPEHGENATLAWNNYVKDLLLPGLLGPIKNLLAAVVTLYYRHENSNNATIRDWYGVYRSPDHKILREYIKPKPADTSRRASKRKKQNR